MKVRIPAAFRDKEHVHVTIAASRNLPGEKPNERLPRATTRYWKDDENRNENIAWFSTRNRYYASMYFESPACNWSSIHVIAVYVS